MNFKNTSVTTQKEILKRRLGGELFEEMTLDPTAFTDGVCKAGSPIDKDGKFVNGRTTSGGAVSTDDGDVVIDPCCGSGSTLRAAAELGRSAYGFEIDRNFYERAKNEMLVFEKDSQMNISDFIGDTV